MPTRRRFMGALGALLAVTWADWVRAQRGSDAKLRLAIVVAKNSPLNELSIGDLRHLYKGDQIIGPEGKKLLPLALRTGSPERVAFELAVLGLSPDLAASYWIDRKIRGQSGPPKSIESADLLMRVVEKLDVAVGYVRATDVRDIVKVIRIDGKLPGDSGYPAEL